MHERRAVAGAVLLDFAVSPLFAWDVFTPALGRDLDLHEPSLAAVFAVGLAAFAVGVVVGGRVADRVAARTLALLTTGLVVGGLLGSAAAPSMTLLVMSFGVMLGSGTGLGYATAVRVAGTVSSSRGLAIGIVVSAYAAGTVVVAPVAAWLLDAVGRSWTFVVLAALLGICLLAAATLVPADRPRTPRSAQHGKSHQRPTRGPVIMLWAAFCLGSAPALAAFAHAGELGGGATGTAVGVQLLSIGNFAGRIIAGPLSDRIGRPATLHGNSALLVVACAPFAVGAGPPLALVALLLLGTQYGALSALVPAATSDLVPAERFGTTYGLVFSGWGVAGLLAPVAAALVATDAGLDGAFAAAIGAAVASWAAVTTYTMLAGRVRPAGPPST